MAVVAQVIITLDNEKGVSVSGPLTEKVLLYGMIESAKDAIRDYKAPLVQPAVIVPEVRHEKPVNSHGLRIVP